MYFVEYEVIIFRIETFVGIDENHVEITVESGNNVAGISNMKMYAIAVWRAVEIFSDEILQFIVYLNGIQLSVFR